MSDGGQSTRGGKKRFIAYVCTFMYVCIHRDAHNCCRPREWCTVVAGRKTACCESHALRHLPESAQHKQHRAQACIKRRCSTYTHVICVYAGRPQHPTHLNDLDDLHGEDALSSARGALLGVRVDPLRRAGLRHAVEEPPLRPDIDIDIVIVMAS